MREHFAKTGGEHSLVCPVELWRAWDVFVELSRWPAHGADPISHTELAAWQSNFDVRLTPLESMAVRRLDREWMAAPNDRSRTP